MAIVDSILKAKYRKMLNITSSIDSVSNDTIFYGSLTGNANLYINGIANLQNNTTFGSNLFVNNNSYLNNNLNINSNLNLKNNIIINNNLSINSNLNSNNINLNNVSIYSDLYVSGFSYINIVNCNKLFVSFNTILNNNLTINSNLNISGNSNLNNLNINSNLYCSNTSIFNSNLSINSNLYVSNISQINGCLTTNSNLYNSGQSIFNNTSILSNLYISNSSFFKGNTNFIGSVTVSSNLYGASNIYLTNMKVNKIAIPQLQEYQFNANAYSAGTPLYRFYRTGDILKIRVDIAPPILQLTGNSTITLAKGQTYIDPGVGTVDNLNETIIPYITAITYNSNNYLLNSIPLLSSTTVSALNTALVGTTIITYTGTDSYNNSSSITRTINIVLDNIYPTITLIGNNPLKIAVNTSYIEYGVNITNYLNQTLTPVIIGTVNSSRIGKYLLTYTITDYSGNSSSVIRTVYVLDQNNKPAYQFNNPNTYLYLANNYNLLSTSQYWTIESWVYLTSYSNTQCYDLIDFRNLPNNNSNGQFVLIISNSGILGYWYGSNNSFNYCPGTINVPLNTWTHIVYQRNGIFMDFYINGTFIGNLKIGTLFDYPNLNNLNQITLGHSVDQSLSTNNYHFQGSISHLKISLGKKYSIAFIPNNDLSNDLSNTLFLLNNNYYDIITNTQMTYPTNLAPNIWNRQYFINLPYTNIESRNLVFNLQVLNLPLTNTTWIDTTGNFGFIVHPNANNFNSLTKIQNNYGWKRSGNIGWTMNSSSILALQNQNWLNGFTLEQWIYIDYDFIPSQSVSMLLAGQSSIFNQNDYGFIFNQTNFPFNTYYGNILAFSTNVVLSNHGTGAGAININNILGQWNHLAVTQYIDTNSISYYNTTNGNLYSNSNSSTFANMVLGDFTCEVWIYFIGPYQQSTDTIFDFRGGNSNGISLGIDYNSNGKTATWMPNFNGGNISVQLNTWTHLAWVRTMQSMKVYVNGALDVSLTCPLIFSFGNLILGNNNGGLNSGAFFRGYISQACISSYQKYTSVFTPTNDLRSTIDFRTLFLLSNDYKNAIDNSNLNVSGNVSESFRTNANNSLNIYVNSGLVITLNSSQWSNWCNPGESTNPFTIGCNSNNGTIDSGSLNKVHFGNTRMYNRMLFQDEIFNNYNYELPFYQNPTSDIFFIKPINNILSSTITAYDFTTGWLSQTVDLNKLRIASSWTIECWAYSTSWGSSNDAAWVIDLSTGANYLSFGVTSNNNNGNGTPFIYYTGDTVNQWKINTTLLVPLNQWNHLVWQKNNENNLEMFLNGISSGIFNINANDWNYPNFVSSNALNNIIIGASSINLGSSNNHWKGKLSQVKISLGKKYIGTFNPLFDLSLNDNGLFLLQDNFINNSIGKSMFNNSNVFIPSYSFPSITLNGSNSLTLFAGINNYTELGAYISYYTRTQKITQKITGNVNTSIIGLYDIIYTVIDSLSNINYVKRLVNVIQYNIPPIITLIGAAIISLMINTTYVEQGVTITNNLGQTINPVISGTVNTSIIGQYIITYSATDSYGNSANVTRLIYITNLPINELYFWLDPSLQNTLTLNSSNQVTNILDISGNGILMYNNVNIPNLTTNTITSLAMLDFTNSSAMRSVNAYPNSYNVTVAIIVTYFQNTNNGGIWGHYPDGGWDNYICIRNSNGTNNISWRTNNDNTNVVIPYIPSIQVMYIGVLSNGTYRYFKMINLNTGEETTITGSNPLSMGITNGYFWLGSLNSTTSYMSLCYVGEVMYWKRILNSSEIYTIESYLYNKWGNQYGNLIYTTLTPVLTLKGESEYYLLPNGTYIEEGSTITSILDSNLTPIISGLYDVTTLGTYTLTYTLTYGNNFTVAINRLIKVVTILPPISYNVTNGNLQISSGLNFNSLNNTDWTIEIWLFMNQIDNGNNSIIIDFRNPNQGSNSPPNHFWTQIINMKPVIQAMSNKSQIGSSITTTISLNTWTHVVWMRKNNIIYTFINGLASPGESVPSYLNSLASLNQIVMGTYADWVTNTNANFKGLLCQPLITLGAKYIITGFTSYWYLRPSNFTNTLFWLDNNIDTISSQNIIFNNTIITRFIDIVPILPIITLNGINPYYILTGSIYNDLGVTGVSYLTNSSLQPYITSITDVNGNQLISTPILANITNIISNSIINTISLTTYTITYSVTDINGTSTITRIVNTINAIPAISYNITAGYLGPITPNNLSKNNWTIECWVYQTAYPTNPTDLSCGIFDFRFINPLYDTHIMVPYIYNNGSIGIWAPDGNSFSATTRSSNTVTLNKWTHIAWMCYNNNIYSFINGVSTLIATNPSWINTLYSLNSITLCVDNSFINTDITRYKFIGQISQPLIMIGAKYNITGFSPIWNLRPSNMTNILFWLENDVDTNSYKIMTLNNTVIKNTLTNSPIGPIITLNGPNSYYQLKNSTFTDLGATAINYLTGVTESITASGTVDTSTIGKYTITYTSIDNSYNTSTITRTVYVVNTNIEILNTSELTLWIDASNSSKITINNGNITAINDLSTNNIQMIPYYSTAQLLTNDINNLSTIAISNSGFISTSTYQNSANITFAIVMKIYQNNDYGLIFGHYANEAWDSSFQFRMCAGTNNAEIGGGLINYVLTVNTTPVLFIGTMTSTVVNLKMINLLTGTTVNNIPNSPSNMTLGNFKFYMGKFSNSSSYNGRYNIGEVMYWKRVLTNTEQNTIISYILSKWSTLTTYNSQPLVNVIFSNSTKTIKPIIILNGQSIINLQIYSAYTELGATATDLFGNIICTTSGTVNINQLGTYTITYTASNIYETTSLTRTINIVLSILPTSDISFWIDPSSNSTVSNNGNYVSIIDKSINNINMISYVSTPKIKSNGINNLSVLDFTNSSSLISSSKLMNSYNVTLAIIVTFFQNTNWGSIWGHFNNHDNDISLRNTAGTSYINWHTNNDNSSVQMQYLPSIPVLYLGTLTNGTSRFFKMINLQTGAIQTVSGSNPLTMTLQNNNIYLGSSENITELALCYVGECMYWKRVLTSTEQNTIINYLVGKWSSLTTFNSQPLIAIINPTSVLPTIKLNGSNIINIKLNSIYYEFGITATDLFNNTISTYTVSGTVNTSVIGQYILTYTVIDIHGVSNSITRTVNVVTSILSISYDTTNGWLGPISNNYNSLNNVDWTIEAWIYCTSYSTNYSFIFDTRIPNNNTSSLWSGQFATVFNSSGYLYIYLGSTNNYSSQMTQQQVPLNKWTHLVWMRKNNNLYGIIDGICGLAVSVPSGLNTINSSNNMSLGCSVNLPTNQGYILKGQIRQPLITLGAKYDISNFTPVWNLIPSSFINVLLWIQNGIDIISNNTIILNNTIIQNTLLPSIVLNGSNIIYIILNKVYVELGAIASNFGNTLSYTTTGSVDITTIGVYIITYTVTDSYGTATINRTINVVANMPIISYDTSNGWLGPLVNNYNSMSGVDWTIEAWVYPTTVPSGDGIVLFDFGGYPMQRTLNINSSFACILYTDFTMSIFDNYNWAWYGRSTIKLTQNTWNHIGWMRYNNSLYVFINGVINNLGSSITFLNNLSNMNSLVLCASTYRLTQNGATTQTNRFLGRICQPLIILGAKYSINGFIPQWNLRPLTFNNVLFWLDNNVDVISDKTIINQNTIINTILINSPIAPIINLNGANKIYLLQNSVYTELGANVLDYYGKTLSYTISNSVNISTIGTNTLTYTTTQNNLSSNITRTINIVNINYALTLIPSISYNTTNGWLGPITNNYNSLNGVDWTIEAWIYCTSYSTNYSYIFDTRIPNNNTSSLWSGQFATVFNTLGYLYLYIGSTNNYSSQMTQLQVPLNKWTHLVWMRKNNNLYGIINGISGFAVSVPLTLNTINASNNMSLGCSVNQPTNQSNILKGQICQPLITLGAKYDTTGFLPQWDLTPYDLTYVLFWLQNSIDVKTGNTISLNNIVLQNILTTIPFTYSTISLIGNSNYNILVGSTYIEPGVNCIAFNNISLAIYITSIKNINNVELLSSYIYVDGKFTSISNTIINTTNTTTYTITYTAIDNNGILINIKRTINVVANIPIISYDVSSGYLGPLVKNNINNIDWTIECWIYQTTNSNNDTTSIFDFRDTNPYTDTHTMFTYINNSTKCIGIWAADGNNYSATTTSSNTVSLNTWTHLVWMRYNNNIYAFINGICTKIATSPSWSNNLISLNSITIGIDVYWRYSQNQTNLLNNKFYGQICQPLIMIGAKYNILGFTPKWDLTPLIYSNVLFWIQNGLDIISNTTITLNYTVNQNYLNTSPIIPIINLNSSINTLVPINTIYTDLGATVQYIINQNVIPYITSITDGNGNEYITTPLNGLNSNIISNIDTTILGAVYTITYTVVYNNTSKTTNTRNVFIVNIPITDVYLWIDASDNSTITKNNSNISIIKDKSSNNVNMIPYYGNTQITTTGINNLSVININNTGFISSTTYSNSYNYTFAIVITIYQTNDWGLIFGHYPINNWDAALQFRMVSGTNNVEIPSTVLQTINSTPVLFVATRTNSLLTLKMTNLTNGVSTSITSSAPTSISLGNYNFFIGKLNSSGSYNGKFNIGEIMYWNRVLITQEINNIEAYLFSKWSSYTNITPVLTLNGFSNTYISLGSTYTDLGITFKYILDPNIIPYITSITDSNGTELLINSLNALTTNIIPNSIIYTSILNAVYKITYTLIINNMIYTTTRTITVVNIPFSDIYFWIDPSDNSTINLDSNNNIINVYDKSSNNINMIPYNINSNYSKINTTQYILPMIDTTNGSGLISKTVYNFPTNSNYTIAGIVMFTSNVGNYGTILGHYSLVGNYHNNPVHLRYETNSNINFLVSRQDPWDCLLPINKNNIPYLFIATFNNGTKNLKLVNLLDNTTQIITKTSNISVYQTNGNIFIGVSDSNEKLNGYIGEEMYWQRVLSTVEQNNIASYLYLKWSSYRNIVPVLSLNGPSTAYVLLNSNYTDLGVNLQFIINPNLIPYITSIIDNNNTQYITTPLNAFNLNVINNLNTSNLINTFTITYSVQYNGNTITLTRLLNVYSSYVYKIGLPSSSSSNSWINALYYNYSSNGFSNGLGALNQNKNWTVEAWLYIPFPNQVNYRLLFLDFVSPTGASGNYTSWFNLRYFSNNLYPNLHSYSGGGYAEQLVPTNQWIHIAYVYSSSGSRPGFYFYVNGQGIIAIPDDNVSPTNLTNFSPTINNICIGRRGDAVSTGYTFSGYLYHLGIYSYSKYTQNFTPSNDLSPTNYSNVLFFLGPNYMDLKNNVQLLQDPNNKTNVSINQWLSSY